MIIIKVREADEIEDFLDIDENIFEPDSETTYKNEPIYILHYPEFDKPSSISFGKGLEKLNP